MKTEQLIEAMAADAEIERPVSQVLPYGVLVAAALVGIVFLIAVGQRADPSAVWTEWNVAIKQIFPIPLAIGGFGAVLRLSRPGATIGVWPLLVAVGGLMALVAVAVELMIRPRALWHTDMMGQTHMFCLGAIPLMSLPILGVSLWALSRGASTRPTLSGAIAGLMSGGTATALYAIHCPEDSPLFYGTWYMLGILIATLLGALLGRRLLRW